MLKIKDNVDLKELEKYGFNRRYSEYTGELHEYQHKNFEFVYVTVKDRLLNLSNPYFKNEREYYLLIYDLIKDGLVEKVE